MTDDRDFDRAMDDWLADGSDRTPQPAVGAVLLAIKTTPQERDLRISWRTPTMSMPMRMAAGIAIVAVLGLATLNFIGRGSGVGAGPTPPTTTSPSPTPSPTASPSPSPNLVDTATWTTYVSARYGFSIAHPADWIEQPSDHAWTLAKGGSCCPPDTAFENFTLTTTPNLGIVVSAWSVAVPPGTSVDSWIQAYCRPKNTTPCTGIQSRAVAATMDGHSGLLVPFTDDVQAFFLVDGRIYAIACWRPEADASTLPYSGSQRLLEAFLSTMRLLPGGPAPSAAAPGPS